MQTIPGLSGWMKSIVDPIPRLPQGCTDRGETAAAIGKFWRDEWKEEPLERECLRRARECLVQPIKELASRSKTAGMEWTMPDEDAWKKERTLALQGQETQMAC